MDDRMKAVAKACLEGAEGNTMTFPQVVGALMAQGFEAYGIDLRRAVAIYYTPNGESVELSTHKIERSVAASFDAVAIQSAIQDAQRLVPGYTYLGFCEKIASAGCAAYMVSFSGRRALYIGRTAETHVEYFPK